MERNTKKNMTKYVILCLSYVGVAFTILSIPISYNSAFMNIVSTLILVNSFYVNKHIDSGYSIFAYSSISFL